MVPCSVCGEQNPDNGTICCKCGEALHWPPSAHLPSTGGVSKSQAPAHDVLFGQYPPASHVKRFVAFFLDCLALVLLIYCLVLIVPGISDSQSRGLSVVYFVLVWGITGTSVGKALMGLSLTKLDGYKPGLLRALVRVVVMFCLSLFWITWWPTLARKDRRSIHDLVSGTIVVEKPTSRVTAAVVVICLLITAGVLTAIGTYSS